MNTKIIDNESDISDIKDGTAQLNPRSFISGRFDSQEFVSANLNASGWYTIAELAAINGNTVSAQFIIESGATMYNITASIRTRDVARTHINTTIRIDAISYNLSITGLVGFRIAKSDTVGDAGAKLQINVISSITPVIQMTANVGDNAGWELVTPYLNDTPTLPDGVTVGTFLEAGEEYDLDQSIDIIEPSIMIHPVDANSINVIVDWPEIPKQGTGIVVTLASTSTKIVDNSANTYTLSGALTTSNFEIKGKRVIFTITETGNFTGIVVGAQAFWRNYGGGCKLTIT